MRSHIIRLLLLAPLALILVNFQSFLNHVTYFLSGEISRTIIQDNWPLVALNIILFLSFLAFLNVRRRIDWSPAHVGGVGVYAAFIVSLFVEMYGVPLTIFLGSGLVSGPSTPPAVLLTVPTPVAVLTLNLWMLLGVAITIIGMAVVTVGWRQVYTAEGLQTAGLYKYSRNPQYVGLILIALGWVIGWPTILTLTLFPLLTYAYYRLSKMEEDDMVDEYGMEYQKYARKVPLLI